MVCTLTFLPWYDFTGRELIRYSVCWTYSLAVSETTTERHTRDKRNGLGTNKRTRIRMCPRQFVHHTECPNDVSSQLSHDRWHWCGYQIIWKTYARPQNRIVQEAAIKDLDTWCQRHHAECPIGVKRCHYDVIWRQCEYHNITKTLDNCPCTVLPICNDILWRACVSYL